MEKAIEQGLTLLLSQYGVMGLVVVGLVIDRIVLLREQRTDRKLYVELLEKTTAALTASTGAVTLQAQAQMRAADASRDVAAAVEAMDRTVDRIDRASSDWGCKA